MSFECDKCHRTATGIGAAEVHFRFTSYGRCETCGRTRECVECRCAGDWAKAYRASKGAAGG